MINVLKTGAFAMMNLNHHGKRSKVKVIFFLKSAF